MKKKNVLLLIFFLFALQFTNADSIDISVGGGFTGYFIPTVNYSSFETTVILPAPLGTVITTSQGLNLLFGFALTAPVAFTYYFNNGWGVGAVAELGYNFQAGPHVYTKDALTGYIPTDYSYVFNSFLGIFNFMAKTPKLKYDFRVVMEFGLILRPGALIGFYRSDRLRYGLASGTTDFRGICYVGPNMFIGFQKEIAKSIIIMPGFRFSPEFAYYDDHVITSSVYKEFYVQVNFGLEFRVLWNKNIPLSSGSSNKSTTTNKGNSNNKGKTDNKSKSNNKKKDDYK